MLSLLTAKPLLWATGVLSILLALSAAWNVRSLKQLGAARAECEVTKLEDSSARSNLVRDLEADSLRNQVTLLEEELARLKDANKEIARRHGVTKELLTEYERQLNEARKADSALDQPADTARLRALEDAYRVRTEGSGDSQVPSNP